MIDYDRIRKECYWDLNITADDIKEIQNGSDLRSRALLFEKLLNNSTKLLLDLQLFNIEDLSRMLEEYTVPKFKSDYIIRRKNIVEVFFFNKTLAIDELKWPA